MTKFDNKINGNTVSADEYNNIVGAPKNLIENSGQTIDSSNTQLSKAVANYVASGSFYTDSGIADAYVLNTTGSFQAPTQYVDGMEIRFRTSNTNTGASTINVNGLGVKNIKNSDGTTDILAGFISNNRDISLRFYNDCFIPSNEITQAAISTAGQSLLPDQITISNGTDSDHDIDFTAGNFNFDDGSGQAVATALTKQIDAAWVEGDNAGGLDTGSVAADSTYYCFAIYNPTTSTADFLFSTSSSSPTLPSGYTKKKRIASLVTDGAGNIRNGSYTFFGGGYTFRYINRITEFSGTWASTSTQGIVAPPNSFVILDVQNNSNSTTNINFYSLYETGSGFALRNDWHPGSWSGGYNNKTFDIQVDNSSNIGISGSGGGTGVIYNIGWIEYL